MELQRTAWLPFIGTLPPKTGFAPGRRDIEYVFKIADSMDELLQAFHLLYQEYLSVGYISEKPGQVLFTKYHLLPETCVFIAKSQKNVLSTTTLVHDSGLFGLPMDGLYGDELSTLRKKRRNIVEVGSLASDRHAFSRSGINNFMKLILLYCVFSNVDDGLVMVNPRHVQHYKNRYGFNVFGEEKFYPQVNAPAVALHVDVRAMREKFNSAYCNFPFRQELYANYLSMKIVLSKNILNAFDNDATAYMHSNPMNARFFNQFLCGKNGDLSELPLECKNYLRKVYPGIKIENSIDL